MLYCKAKVAYNGVVVYHCHFNAALDAGRVERGLIRYYRTLLSALKLRCAFASQI